MWLTRANEAGSDVFSRAILAKSARIQTVVCIPLMDGVLELGTTEKVEEDLGLIQHATNIFSDFLDSQPNPALSEHSTSNPVTFVDQSLFHSQISAIIQPMYTNPHESNRQENDDDNDADEDDNDDNGDDELEAGSDSEEETDRYNAAPSHPNHPSFDTADAEIPVADPTELMQIEMSEGIRLGSPDDCLNNLNLQMCAMIPSSSSQSDLHRDDPYQAWHSLHEDLCNRFPQTPDTQIQDLTAEDAHYSRTVSSILQQNSSHNSRSMGQLAHSPQTVFCKWNYRDQIHPLLTEGTSQWVLKYILFTVPNLHSKYKDDNSPDSRDGDAGSRYRKGTPQEELSANHVLAERRRREKLNERFIILRSLVPFVTKMDKASILGDTIEYVKQLRRRIQDLEAQNRQMESNHRSKETELNRTNSKDQTVQIDGNSNVVQQATSCRNKVFSTDKRKLRELKGSNGTAKAAKSVEASSGNVQVSIIESDALLELQCPYRDGLLLKIMQSFDELQLEVISVQSSSTNSTFTAEVRAKVKELQGKKASVGKVKKAMQLIFSQYCLY